MIVLVTDRFEDWRLRSRSIHSASTPARAAGHSPLPTPHSHSPLMPTRRQFIRTSLTVGGAMLTGCGRPVADAMNAASGQASRPQMKLLILGGTGFIGPHLVRHA